MNCISFANYSQDFLLIGLHWLKLCIEELCIGYCMAELFWAEQFEAIFYTSMERKKIHVLSSIKLNCRILR